MLQYRNILVPVDFSDMSRMALNKGISARDVHQCNLTLLHVVDYLPPPYASADVTEIFPGSELLIERAETHLSDLASELCASGCQQIVLGGKTVELLVDYVRQHAIDLVVMAAHNEPAVDRALGSTTARVVQKVSCDVLVIHG